MATTADRAQRVASIALGLAALGVASALAFVPVKGSARRPADAGLDAPAPATLASASLDAGDVDEDAGAPAAIETTDDDAGGLQKGAPKQVRLGVVLVQYAGAQGAPPNARTKAQAEELAQRIATTAQTDFRRAVLDGDSGSAEDVGRIPRGTLDPHTEVAVFGLAVGETSGVLPTPRGYWIVKRTE
ncbi:MAG: peptidylprolyl isomerase [Myxococcales bacterium]|nr:peptidylprolyl isomerase [Myxococcales bacterium]